jgi:hypothetical protein
MTGEHLTVDLSTLNRQLKAVSADLELIALAYMEGRAAGFCFTGAEVAEWVSRYRRREIAMERSVLHDAKGGPLLGLTELNEAQGSRSPHWFQENSAPPYCALCGAGRLHAIHQPTGSSLAAHMREQLDIRNCPDCREAAAHAYSDATTPGLFYPRCEKHRAVSVEKPGNDPNQRNSRDREPQGGA